MKKKRLGDILVERGTLRQADIDQALVMQREKNARLGEILMQNLHVSKTEIGNALEQVQGVQYVDCPPAHIATEVLALLPRATAVKCCALPLEVRAGALIVALAEPQDLKILEEIRFSTGRIVSPRFSFREDIQHGIRKFYDKEELAKALVLKDLDSPGTDESLKASPEEEVTLTQLEFIVASTREDNKEILKELRSGVEKRGYAIRLLSLILSRAAEREASDIHFEPRVDSTVVRMRVDGILQELMKIPQMHQSTVLQRVKNLADMDPGAHRVPQEGRFLIIHRGRRLDVRVSTLPTYFGEKVLIRILDPRSTLRTFEQLGMARHHEDSVRKILGSPQGMLVVTGPTASGKSTTLYSALKAVASSSKSVVAVEDPIEYMLEGITQVQLNIGSGLSVPTMLQAVLRQNPNVIMIGELLDEETADIALRAAQIGHLVLTTLHTNDCVDAITRLRSFGMPSNMLSSISGIIGQRLLRTLCSCRKEVDPTSDYRRDLKAMNFLKEVPRMYVREGCSLCDNTGYRGRVAIFELLLVEGPVREAIQTEQPTDAIRRILVDGTFRSMRHDALDKVLQGITTLEEVQRILPATN